MIRELPGARIIARDDMMAAAASFLDARSGLAAAMVLAMALALALVAADKTISPGADAQREIGVLRALGWRTSEILTAKAWEAGAVSVTALLAGMAAAYAHVYLLGAPLFTAMLKGWEVVEPAFSPVPAFDIPFLSAVSAAVVLLPLAGSLLAARRAACGEPDSLIRE
jgi:ABC-type lipoprotein release transport system permease subunit